ncbi:MAG: carbohydrate-binding family 9-like protein [Bacteroidales bacterium]|nr:carbohydrate-binding family 9-like protein [Bacteroidales bacterium]
MKINFLQLLLLSLAILQFSESQAQESSKLKESTASTKTATESLQITKPNPQNQAKMPVVYVEMLPKPAPDKKENRQGFIAYPSLPFRMSFEYSRPDSTRLTEISVFAAKGEVIPITFCVYALRDINNVVLELTDLKGHDGAVIPATCLTKNIVKYLNKRFMYQKIKYLVDAPVYITSLESPVSISGDRSEKFWINFKSPEDARPGVYKGTITIQTKDAFQRIPLSVQILPFTLPEQKGLIYGMYYSNYKQVFDNLKTVDDVRVQIRHDLADMRAHGMTSIGLCNGVDPSSFTVTDDGKVRFNFTGNTLFELVMEAYKENKFTEPVIDMSKAVQKATADLKLGTPEYDALYVEFYKELAREGRLRGWPVMYIQPYDEPGWHSQKERDDNLYMLKVLKAAGIPTEVDGPGDNYFVNIAGPFAGLWNYNAALSSAEDVRRAQAENHKVTLYNYDVSGWLGECGRWSCGLFNWKFGLNGAFNWIYFGGRSDLYNDLDGNNGDWMHWYPKNDIHPGGPSIGWEGIRQGINDRHYLELCQSTIEKAKARGGAAAEAANAAEKMLEELRASLSNNLASQYKNMDWTINLTEKEAGKYSYPDSEEKVFAYVSGDYKYSNNLKLEDYDKIRWMVAANIVNMLEKSGEISFTGITVPSPVSLSKGIPKPASAQKVLKIPTLVDAPVIDGKIAPNEWKGTVEVKLMLNDQYADPQMPTKVLCGFNSGTLYVAFSCTEEVIDYLIMDATKQKGIVTNDDCVEVFLDPGLTQSKFYHVAVNPRGTFLADGSYDGWNPDIKTAASVNKDKMEWVVELAIPVGGMKLDQPFGLNFNRERRPKDALLELSSWTMTGSSFGRVERFGTAIIY